MLRTYQGFLRRIKENVVFVLKLLLVNFPQKIKIVLTIKGLSKWRRAVPVDRLARLAEISPSFKNVLKKKCLHMITEPARLTEISVDLGMKISHMNSHPG